MSARAATAIPVDRSASLFRWNAGLAALHFVQAVAILPLSFARNPIVTPPVVSTYLRYDAVTGHLAYTQRSTWDLPIGPAVAPFFLTSAIAHITRAFPARRWYATHRARGQDPIRRIEYSFGSSVMIVVIAALAGVQEVGTLIAIFVSLLVAFSVSAINLVLQYQKVGGWRDHLYGERAPMLLSLVATARSDTRPLMYLRGWRRGRARAGEGGAIQMAEPVCCRQIPASRLRPLRPAGGSSGAGRHPAAAIG